MTRQTRAFHERAPNRFVFAYALTFVLIALILLVLQPGYDPGFQGRS